jgi:hypothetical protein
MARFGSGSAGGGGRRRRPKPTAARLGARRSPIEIDAPGVKTTRAWAREVQRNMRDPPEAKAGLGDALGCMRGGGGGPARRRTPACAVLA